MTSPPFRVPIARQVVRSTVSLTNRTEPSQRATFTPPGWLLLAESRIRRLAGYMQDRLLGGVACRYIDSQLRDHDQGPPSSLRPWYDRFLISRARHPAIASSKPFGAVPGLK